MRSGDGGVGEEGELYRVRRSSLVDFGSDFDKILAKFDKISALNLVKFDEIRFKIRQTRLMNPSRDEVDDAPVEEVGEGHEARRGREAVRQPSWHPAIRINFTNSAFNYYL